MNHATALTYWAIVALWLTVLFTICVVYVRNPRTFGAARLLLAVLAIDTTRNVIENVYFGLYFGARYGLFPDAVAGLLGQPHLLILPKIFNVAAALVVISLLLLRWLPMSETERVAASHALDHAERRFGLLVDGVKEYAIYLLDSTGHVTSWNPGAQRIKGYASAEVIGGHFGRFYTEDDRAAGAPEQALAIAEREGSFETEALRVRKDGTTFWAHVVIEAIRDDSGSLIGFAKVTKDITEARTAEANLRQLAHFDQLTGLPNRVSLLRDLDSHLCPPDGSRPEPTSIALLDLDGFRDINDTLGHAMGDHVLAEVARRFEDAAGTVGRVYRLGGDEFVLVVPDRGNPPVFLDIVKSVLNKLEPRFAIEGHSIFVRASAGIAVGHEEPDASGLIARADLALHDAKRAGGHRVSWFMPEMQAKAKARQQLDTELRHAGSEGEFEVFFQPQIRLCDQVVVGAEALLRWRHPQRGLLTPDAFIEALAVSPIAVETGNWILQASCEAAVSWRASGFSPVRIGVNLFPAQFHDGLLLADVETALRRTGLPPDALELEITENIALGHDDEILPKLRALRAMGVGLAFDDFGTGYASLSCLSRYPLTRIKVDRAFVRKIGRHAPSEDTAIVRSMIAMGHNLGLEVIAEGVDSPDQAEFLSARRCDEAQGYLYARPLSAAEFKRFLEDTEKRKQETATTGRIFVG